MDPSVYEQLQGKRNARAWKRKFKVAALSKGVWDMFNGVYIVVSCPLLVTTPRTRKEKKKSLK